MIEGDPATQHLVAQRRQAAEGRLEEAVGAGGSLCAIGRGRQSFPAVKYHEGAVAALMEVQRGSDPTEVLARWRDAARSRLAQAPDWAAYRAGGVDEITGLLENLDTDRDR